MSVANRRSDKMTGGYDVIGDVHGHTSKLTALLSKLEYREVEGVWQHPERTAVFVGDFIDRGPHQVRTCQLVKAMVESGSALAVMGNHEFNALAFHTPGEGGEPLRPHSDKNVRQHEAFLTDTADRPELRDELLNWFWSLPLWLDLDGIRMVHACWHDGLMSELKPRLRSGNRLDLSTLLAASTGENGSYRSDGSAREVALEFRAIETLLKGLEVDLPDGATFVDKDGHQRQSVRVEWWRHDRPTYQEAALVPAKDRPLLPDVTVPNAALPGYRGTKPVFIGHYWMTGTPALLTENVACVDYSAGKGGALVAYRWSGEETLEPGNFMASDAN
jgi:hypothetical protein